MRNAQIIPEATNKLTKAVRNGVFWALEIIFKEKLTSA